MILFTSARGFRFAAAALGIALLSGGQAGASARPKHLHEDLIGEKDLLLGFKAGMLASMHSPITTSTGSVAVPTEPRARAGLVAEFIYEFPRFEIGAYGVSRAGVRSSESAYGFAIPLLVKIPFSLGEGGPGETVDLELGGGYESRWIFSSTRPQRTSQQAWIASAGVLIDFTTFLISAEFRYVHGTESVEQTLVGGYPEDYELLFGYHWRE